MSILPLLVALAAQSQGDSANRTLRFEMQPSGDPQMAVWLEDAQGTYVDTMMVTRLTGTFGLGNRPGRPDFGGGYLWPYGRRENVLPVWAHRRGASYPRIVFQDCREDSLGWHERHSSEEPFYCRPLSSQEQSVDAVTCPTSRFNSDKGIPMAQADTTNPLCRELIDRYGTDRSLYPPRNDLDRVDPGRDWDGLDGFDRMNDLDAVSQATPPSGELFRRSFKLPAGLAEGTYTLYVEVNQAFDANGDHDYDFFIDPMLRNYGVKVIGQPSVVWELPVVIGPESTVAYASEFAGYGSVTGQDGNLNPPDGTITVGVGGTGAGRLLPIQGEGSTTYQIRANVVVPGSGGGTGGGGTGGCEAPEAPFALEQTFVDWRGVDLLVQMSGASNVRYEVRYARGHGAIATDADYVAAVPGPQLSPGDVTSMAVRIDMPRDQTPYTVAVRAVADCGETSEFVTLDVTTERRVFQSIDACFVATAAHGAHYAEEVSTLRSFRDEVLLPSDAGLAAVELYYYVSPPLADTIRDSDELRAATRWALTPLVWLAENL